MDEDYEEARLQISYIIENYEKILKGEHPVCAICGRKRPKLHFMDKIDDVICDECSEFII